MIKIPTVGLIETPTILALCSYHSMVCYGQKSAHPALMRIALNIVRSTSMNKAKRPTRFGNIDALVKSGGDITIGRVGPVPCAATAADESQSLAMLVRRPRESLDALMDRLDQAIGKAWDEEEYIDEING
ncbi:MAG: hypothetical protein P0120_17295 [Nitrospira sp.]|nr:hypothetical protein [Nitrospira sp.]